MKKRLSPSSFNTISLIGFTIFVLNLAITIFLTLVELLASETKPYIGIITFIVLPFFMIIGLLLFFYGIKRERRLIKKGLPHSEKLPVIDLNNKRHRKVLVIALTGTVLLILFSAFGSFKAYEYTDSNAFCGTTCHEVMNPEYTAYKYSPHARVKCAECHIGSGAKWYIKSKISGTHQLFAVLFNTYPKPIATPISNLRPAQETCEQCHWPKLFFSEKRINKKYFLSDEKNTPWSLDLLLKVGGGNIESGPTSGIHWHMNINNKIEYYATDSRRQEIPWVKSTHKDGKSTVYKNTENDFDESTMDPESIRRMDCLDCHNRPAHSYKNPTVMVNEALSLKWIDRDLPYIKSVAVEALEAGYQTKENAMDSIGLAIRSYYESDYPEIATRDKDKIQGAITKVQEIYQRNYFPSMNVNWTKYPDNIGHLHSDGCFRCHDGNHVSDDGKTLSRKCNTCHIILDQKTGDNEMRLSLSGVDYKHPAEAPDDWKDTNCSECHGE